MSVILRKVCFKYSKCIMVSVLVAFFVQIFVAISFFPSINDNLPRKHGYIWIPKQEQADVSARKNNFVYSDDEDLNSIPNLQVKPASQLRLEELDFKPPCDIKGREAISAIHRAKTQVCKQLIANKTCLIQESNFYPYSLPNRCQHEGKTYGKYLGCYADEKKMRLLFGFYGNYASTNSHIACLEICVQGGFTYTGVQYASECFCGDSMPPLTSQVSDELCDMKCPGAADETCGGYFTMNVFETGLTKFVAKLPATSTDQGTSVRIVFLLTLNGRALRQVHRLINALYRQNHYFYIHVDTRQDYLHRKLTALEKQFPNIKLATNRYSTIWGGASLLTMLLSAMKDLFALGWQWDFVINLSESDFPIKSLESLEQFLAANKGSNFVKSHGREVQRFIKKQGLDKTFVECETHMWRIGERKLPKGIVIDGGSDWIALSPDFVAYVVGKQDELLTGLEIVFQHTLLPAESFFHTVLRNSRYCSTYIDNNLHVTNWKRKLGCKCQYKHVVDWCGCSPNDFRPDDWPRIQNTGDRQLFFARKFEPIINQEIINRVEEFIGIKDHHLLNNLEAYWQSIYNFEDLTSSTDDTYLSHAESIVRHSAKILSEEGCHVQPDMIVEISSYSYADVFMGNLILHRASVDDGTEVIIETWYKPKQFIEWTSESTSNNIKIFKVSSEYDLKETMFRNFANILGPFSEPALLYQFSPNIDKKTENFTVMWLDPAGVIADINSIHVDETNLTNFIKPQLKAPLLPGIWKVGLFELNNLLVSTKFLITPVEYFAGKELSHQEADIIHSGSQNSYKNFSNVKPTPFLPNNVERTLLRKMSVSNVKRISKDLREWIDGLSVEFYSVLGSCLARSNNLKNNLKCGNHKLDSCETTQWSSLSRDPKGTIGKLNKVTGRLDRT